MPTIHPSKIFVSPDRQRKTRDEIEEMADSIRRIGQIQPIVVKPDFTLVAGGRRTAACALLGVEVEYKFITEVSVLQLQLIELEENTKRKDLPWQDRACAVSRIHSLAKSYDPSLTTDKLAEQIGMSPGYLLKYLAVANEIAANPSGPAATATMLATAYNFIGRRESREIEAELENLLAPTPTLIDGFTGIEVTVPAELAPGETPPLLAPTPRTIENRDALDFFSSHTGPRFNLIHCDFPYGVNINEAQQGALATWDSYADTPEIYRALLHSFILNRDRFIADSAHVMFWFSMKFYSETVLAFEDAGFVVNRFPLIWHKSDNVGLLPDPSRGPRQIYETALLLSRGDRKIVRAKSNCISTPTAKDRAMHVSEKPLPVVEHFLSMLCDDTTVFFDPTAGSGTACRAARSLGAKVILGLELDPVMCESANVAYRS